MKTSARPRDFGDSFSSRRNHVTLSITDPNHHITEAIGNMYGDDDYNRRDSRPLSFVGNGEQPDESGSYFDQSKTQTFRNSRPPPSPTGNLGHKAHTSPNLLSTQANGGFDTGPLSPTLSLRDYGGPHSPADTANSQFPLNDIDYESDPAAVAQELSNLQALRRMSMDVGAASDPDLPSFQSAGMMSSVAPTGGDDEDDPSRLFWVPARVHPELAPMEFKTFLENRVQTIKRRSGDASSLSPDMERADSSGGLRRKKSMLSRQIDNSGGRAAAGYKDGAERLERKKSLRNHDHAPELKISDLQELDALVKDPSKALQKMSMDGKRNDIPGGPDDMPILPAPPGGMALRRSTRTTYRKGSLRKGERVPFSKRAGARATDVESDESRASSPIAGTSSSVPTRSQSDASVSVNFSRPDRSSRREPISPPTNDVDDANSQQRPQKRVTAPTNSFDDIFSNLDKTPEIPSPLESPVKRRGSGSSVRSDMLPKSDTPPPLPQIVETPPQEGESSEEEEQEPVVDPSPALYYPERSTSQQTAPEVPPPVAAPAPAQSQTPVEPPPRSERRPGLSRQHASQPPPPSTPAVQPVIQPVQRVNTGGSTKSQQTLNDLSQQPTPLPGSPASTDSLTLIPTLTEDKDKRADKKGRKQKDDQDGSRKSSWGWFKGGEDKNKKKHDSKSMSKQEKGSDSTRLDVLQSSIDGVSSRGRESLTLERASMDDKLQDERQKESSRKSGGENKKERDGLFSSLFGGGKKKNDRDSGGKKGSSLRTLSPEPPPRQLKPDIDYNWTRFSMLEERAIYRMAHIKLANPRRALYSQVLLSNFMYSYLAKVQLAHPHMQIPQSAQQKKLQEQERRQKEAEQQAYAEQQQREQQLAAQQQQDSQYGKYDYHSGNSQYADPHGQYSEGVDYVDDSQIYDYDHPEDDHSSQSGRPQSRASQHGVTQRERDEERYRAQQAYQSQNQNPNRGYYQDNQHHQDDDDDDDDMW